MPTATSTVTIALGERSYAVHIGAGELARLGERLPLGPAASRVMVVSNPGIAKHYGAAVMQALADAGLEGSLHTVAAGERAKGLRTVARLWDAAIHEARLDRHGAMVALGGGVLGDVVGFAAATLYRGVSFVQVPTTLVAMVDSSVGGKTGINWHGKNLIGAFWQPSLVVADLDTLRTLPPRELRCGLAEVIKHGCILDAGLFERIERELLAGPPLPPLPWGEGAGGQPAYPLSRTARVSEELLRYSVQRSCELKGAVVAEDERETTGRRALLNFGHTFGHAIESGAGYGNWLHGEAVAIGMVLAARAGVRRGELSEDVAARIERVCAAAGLPTRVPKGTDREAVWAAMHKDKKVRAGTIRLTLLRRLGEAFVTGDTPPETIREVLWEAAEEVSDEPG
ncbi:MAG: 3-dehydroquinate synthase [Armatimonadetes bacterium]|nr:3-dehydroquinate synthase [Armatimonadota bacterium]